MKATVIILGVAVTAVLLYIFYQQRGTNSYANTNNPTPNMPFAPQSRIIPGQPLANPAGANTVGFAASFAAAIANAVHPQAVRPASPPSIPGIDSPGTDLFLGAGTTATKAELNAALQTGWVPGLEDPGTDLYASAYDSYSNSDEG